MATNTPAAPGLRQFMRIPHAQTEHENTSQRQAPRPAGGGRSANPLEQGYTGGAGDVDQPYVNPSGGIVAQLIAQKVNSGIASENETKHHMADAAQQARVQAGIDSYQQQLEKTGNPQQALASTFHTDNDGHVHFTDPDTFKAILAMHQVMSQGQQQGQFQSVDLGRGLVGIASPDGKYSVHQAKDVQGNGQFSTQDIGNGLIGTQTPDGKYSVRPGPKPPVDQTGRDTSLSSRVDEQGNKIPTLVNRVTGLSQDVTQGGQQGPPGAGGPIFQSMAKPPKALSTTKAQMDQLTDIQTVLDNVAKMRNTVGATGSLGYGSIERHVAQSTGFGGQQAEAYNAAYNDMAPALVRLSRVPGQSKMVAELALQRLPKPGQATGFNIDQAIPNIEYAMRQQVGGLYQTYKLENRPGAEAEAKQIAQIYNAHPQQMADLEQAKQMLRQNAGQMPDEAVGMLAREMQGGHLAYDDWTRTARQMIQRGMVDPKQFDKWAAASPELSKISPAEMAAPQYVRPFNTPGAQEIPTGQQGAPQGAPQPGPGGPTSPGPTSPGPAPPPPAPAGPQNVAPPPPAAPPPGAAPGPGAEGPSPPDQTAATLPPPGQGPTTGQQQAQMPQLVAGMNAQMAPGAAQQDQGGLLNMLVNHVGPLLGKQFEALHSRLGAIENKLGIGSDATGPQIENQAPPLPSQPTEDETPIPYMPE